MFFKHSYNEKGITLVELLAGIAILGIVTLLVSGALGQLFKSEDTTNKSLSLKQDTNVLINQLRQQYTKTNRSSIKKSLCFNHIGDGIEIDTKNTYIDNENGEFNKSGQCIDNVNTSKPLELTLVTNRKASENDRNDTKPKQVEIKTTFSSPKNGEADVAGSAQILDPENINWDEEGEKLPCKFTGNFKWTGQEMENCKNNKYEIDGHLIKTDDDIDIRKSEIIVGGNFYTEEQMTFKENSSLTVKGDVWSNKQFGAEHSKITIKGNALFSQQTDFDNKSLITIHENAEFNKQLKVEDGTKLYINGNAKFFSQVTISDNDTLVFIKGNALFKDQFELNSRANLTIVKSVEFEMDNYDNYGILCIKGPVTSVIPISGMKLENSKNCDFRIPSELQ